MGVSVSEPARRAVEAGLVAAIVSSAPGLVHVLVTGEPAWRAVQLIATLVGVDRTGRFDAGAFALGGALHLVISVALALVLDRLLRTTSAPRASLLGVAFGLAVYVVNFELTAVLGLAEAVRRGTHDGIELAAHAVYGGTAGWWLTRRR